MATSPAAVSGVEVRLTVVQPAMSNAASMANPADERRARAGLLGRLGRIDADPERA